MVWRENVAEGRYDGKNCPPVFKTYYYPKPWEVLQTGPRADFAEPVENAATDAQDQEPANPYVPESGLEIVPQPVLEAAPKTSSRRNRAIE